MLYTQDLGAAIGFVYDPRFVFFHYAYQSMLFAGDMARIYLRYSARSNRRT